MKHVNGHLVPPRELNPEIPKGINAITTQLLAKNPNERYADAGELIKDLERVIEGLEPAAVSTTRTMSHVVPAGMAQTHAMPGAPVTNRDKRPQRRPWAPILLLILLFLAMLGGLAYTIPRLMAEEITVPDLVGYTSIEEAQGAVGDDFKVKEGDRVPSKEPIDTIVSQNPKVGETANQGSTIFVNVSGTQIADLPDVEGKKRDEAVRILEEAGFKVEEETKESSAGNEGYVVDQTPRGGSGQTAEADSTVKITVGAGPETIQVPDLYNLTPENAKQALEKAGLKLGSQKEEPSSGVASGAIVSQNPTAGSSAKSGSSVDITVSSGPKQIPVPNVVGSYLDAATQTIWNAGFAYTVETIQSNQPAGLVVSTDPPAGTQLDPNSRNVTIRQSAGPPPPAPPPPQAAPPPPPPSPPPANKTGDSKTGDSKSDGSGKSGGNGK
jgi:serine/threonine-protein kinase